ncbi:histidinol-phosphate phosphatase [Neorhodopirellula lusitana]|uniref:Histidinol-phosphatase n=1 Tax=Neorhodopirellula lusitana TaxID=445327 RepID=A0ABY1QPZ4_9BACT|nr:histidinol-phosphatase [Neorhodopirellula lusitana]SMP77033.1 histidinol-phosphate phosphatase [Neorhodopirellula lusitana]
MNAISKQQLCENWQPQHDGRLVAMIEVAIAAGNHTLTHFRRDGLVVDRKGDDSPVTIADREAEQLTRKLLGEQFPDDTIAGEEFAEQAGDSGYRWTVDPIDGTKSFICGVPLYSTLLALELDGEPLGGVILIPALGEIAVAAMGQGCFYNDGLSSPDRQNCASDRGEWTPARVSDRSELSDAVFVTSEVKTFAERDDADAYLRLQSACFLARTWGDGYGYLMVATGKAEVMVDPKCNAWDVAAMVPILTEAGGRFTDWKGTATVRGGDGVGTNGKLHAAVLELLK